MLTNGIPSLLSFLVLSLALSACSKSDTTSSNNGTATASIQLNWDQANWNQANWQ
jgi:major membrane immunogen (membrane-anchored lipoprotein)